MRSRLRQSVLQQFTMPRKGTRLMAERMNEEEWHFLNMANESLQFDIRTTSSGGSAGGLLKMYFPPSFHASLSLLCWRIFFCHNTGGGGVSNAPVSARDMYTKIVTATGSPQNCRVRTASKNKPDHDGQQVLK